MAGLFTIPDLPEYYKNKLITNVNKVLAQKKKLGLQKLNDELCQEMRKEFYQFFVNIFQDYRKYELDPKKEAQR